MSSKTSKKPRPGGIRTAASPLPSARERAARRQDAQVASAVGRGYVKLDRMLGIEFTGRLGLIDQRKREARLLQAEVTWLYEALYARALEVCGLDLSEPGVDWDFVPDSPVGPYFVRKGAAPPPGAVPEPPAPLADEAAALAPPPDPDATADGPAATDAAEEPGAPPA